MKAKDLIDIARQDYLDESPDIVGEAPEFLYNFKTPFLLREVGNAQREACYRQDLRHLYDDTTPEICTIAVLPGTRAYPLDARILRLDDVRLDSRGRLFHSPCRHLPEHVTCSWHFTVQGRALVLPATPPATDTLRLSVWRAPLADPNLNDELEWTAEPEKLAHWLAYRAFMRPNENTMNLKLAEFHRAAFDTAFGRENSAQARAELLSCPASIVFSPLPIRSPFRDNLDSHGWS